MTSNILQELEVVLSLGCERVLTSGGESTALEGTPTIRRMIELTSGRIIVVPGEPLSFLNARCYISLGSFVFNFFVPMLGFLHFIRNCYSTLE